MVVWIYGLSGAGKTELSTRLNSLYSKRFGCPTVLLDGDTLRGAYADALGHSPEERLEASFRMAKFAKVFSNQGHVVICSLVCLYPEAREWMVENIQRNLFVFVNSPLVDVQNRDSKGLYKEYSLKKLTNLAGMDLELPDPHCHDVIIENNGSLNHFLGKAERLFNMIEVEIESRC